MEPKEKSAFSKSAFITSKIISDLDVFDKKVAQWKFKRHKIVFTNGCFDLLHKGHIYYLNKAAELGDRFVLGLNSDHSVKQLGKPSSRPIKDQDSRALILASMHYVDAVIVFNQETPLELIKRIKPDVLVKGGDWKIEEIVGNQEVKMNGGQVVTIPFLEGYSSTSIEQKILKENG